MFLFATLGFIVVQLDRQRKQRAQQVTGSRTEYLRYLGNVRQVAREAADQQRRALNWHHPDPSALPSVAEERSRVWEHGSSDADFLHVRYGVCSQPLSLELVPPESAPIDEVDPAAASALHRLLVVHRLQPKLPASIDLRAFDRIELCGAEDPARSLARAMICSATAFHSPDHLVVAVLCSEQNLLHWDWLKWLPHAQSAQQSDAVGPMRMVSTSLAEIATLLPPDLSDRPRFGADERPPSPHILFVTDGAQLPPGNHVIPPDGLHGVTVLDLPVRWDELEDATRLRLQFAAEPAEDGKQPILALRLREEPVKALADQCDLATAEAFARRLAPLHTVSSGADAGSGEIAGPTDFMDLLGLGDVFHFDPNAAWRPRPARDRLRVPIGVGEGGTPIHLDIKESAQQGMGPHGLVIGATGSGKSEFLRTLVLGLAMTHSPEQLNMVLVDFKGGATFAGMSEMPHVSAVITNLAQELTLVDRMQDALSGEMMRRQELLRDAGNFASIRDYERPAPPASSSTRCRRCSSSSTSSPRCCPRSRSSSTCSSRSAASAGRSASTCCSPRSGWRRAGCAASSPTCPTGSACARSAPASRGRSSAYRTPTSSRRSRASAYLKPDQSTLLRFKAAYVSGPPSGKVRVRRDDGGHVAGHPAVHDLRGAQPGAARAGARGAGAAARSRGRAGVAPRRRRRADDRTRPGRAPGLAAAARRARHPRPADAPTSPRTPSSA